jgi:DNA-binding transcriptional LysR family regulator
MAKSRPVPPARSTRSSRPRHSASPAKTVTLTGATDRLDLLQTFVRIVETGGLSAAAASLGTTQPTVSRRLQQLERLLGCRLVHRSTHGIRLGEGGERCYRHALDLLAGWGEFETELRGAGAEPAGLLRVVVPHAFGQRLLIGPLAEFLRRHPKVAVEWLLRDHAPDFIAEGVDCAIHVGEVHDAAVVAVRLAEVPRIVVAAPCVTEDTAIPAGPRELAALPWLAIKTYYHSEITLRRRGGDETSRIALRPRFSTDNLYALREAALQGLGVAVVSRWLVAEDLASGALRQLAPDWEAAPLPVHIAYPYAKMYPPALRAFVDAMRRLLPAALGETVLPPRAPRRAGHEKSRPGDTPTKAPDTPLK